MPDHVNLTISSWAKTGQKVQVDRWTTTVTIDYKDDQGTPQTWTGTVTFPDDLSLVPAAWLKEALLDLIVRAARRRLGIDSESPPGG